MTAAEKHAWVEGYLAHCVVSLVDDRSVTPSEKLKRLAQKLSARLNDWIKETEK